MSEDLWIKSLVGGLVILILGIASSKGNFDECSLCCILQGSRDDLNCTWSNNSSLQLSLSLQDISTPHNFHYTIPTGQNWLLIPRENLTRHNQYQLTINGGTWMETLNLTYCHGCENVFIRAPVLNSSEEEEGPVLTWTHTDDHSLSPAVELRFRILGTSDWSAVDDSDLDGDSFEMMEPMAYTDYEFQIRYIPNENQDSRSLWSGSYVLNTPEKAPIGSLDVWRDWNQENSQLVMWKPLGRHFARGKILSYQVTYIHNNRSETTEEPCCSITLPARSTHVCVRARNSRGLGNNRCVTSLCSAAASVGDISGEAWGDPSGRIAVRWEESMIYGFSAEFVVEWRKDNSSEVDWTRSDAGNGTLVLPGNFTPGIPYLISIYALHNDCYVKVFSSEAYSQEEVPLSGPTISIHALSSSEVFISWEEIPRQQLRGKLKHYTIYVNSTISSEGHTVYGRNITLSGLLPRTVYHIFITASTAAGEGAPSTRHFQTKGERALHPLTLPFVSLIIVCILVVVVLIHPHVRKVLLMAFWPRIPKPEKAFNNMAANISVPKLPQTPPNPPIEEVEEMEPVSPPTPLLSDRSQAVSFGYEKHFMPTPEEVMGLC